LASKPEIDLNAYAGYILRDLGAKNNVVPFIVLCVCVLSTTFFSCFIIKYYHTSQIKIPIYLNYISN